MIQSDPKHALELTVPLGVRRTLPASVESLLEERVSGKGDLMVLGALPVPGKEGEVKPITRLAKIGGKSYDAYTFGPRAEKYISSYDTPIIGIAAPATAGCARHPTTPSPATARARPRRGSRAGTRARGACGPST